MVDRRVVRGNTYSPFRSNVFNFNIPSKQVNNSSLILSLSGIIFQKLLLQNLPLDSCFIFDTEICFLWGLNFLQLVSYLSEVRLLTVAKQKKR